MSGFLFGLGGQWIILPSLVFKPALFTVIIIIIKSAPSTATQSKIACVIGDTGILHQWYGGGKKKSKIQKIQKNSKKFKKIIERTWCPNIRL